MAPEISLRRAGSSAGWKQSVPAVRSPPILPASTLVPARPAVQIRSMTAPPSPDPRTRPPAGSRRAPPPGRPAAVVPVALAALSLALPELILSGADQGLWGSALWRPLAYS